jgi:hypothetical protein
MTSGLPGNERSFELRLIFGLANGTIVSSMLWHCSLQLIQARLRSAVSSAAVRAREKLVALRPGA